MTSLKSEGWFDTPILKMMNDLLRQYFWLTEMEAAQISISLIFHEKFTPYSVDERHAWLMDPPALLMHLGFRAQAVEPLYHQSSPFDTSFPNAHTYSIIFYREILLHLVECLYKKGSLQLISPTASKQPPFASPEYRPWRNHLRLNTHVELWSLVFFLDDHFLLVPIECVMVILRYKWDQLDPNPFRPNWVESDYQTASLQQKMEDSQCMKNLLMNIGYFPELANEIATELRANENMYMYSPLQWIIRWTQRLTMRGRVSSEQ